MESNLTNYQINTSSPVVIYGAGNRGRSLYYVLNICNFRVLCFLDQKKGGNGLCINKVPIYAPEDIAYHENSKVCLAIADKEEAARVEELLRDFGFRGEFIDYFNTLYSCYRIMTKRLDKTTASQNDSSTVILDCVFGFGMGGIESWVRDICIPLSKTYNVRIVTNRNNYECLDVIRDKLDAIEVDPEADMGSMTFIRAYEYLIKMLPCVVIVNFPDVIMFAASIIKQEHPDSIRIISVVHQGELEYYSVNAMVSSTTSNYLGVSEDITKGLIDHGISDTKCMSITCPVFVPDGLQRDYTIDENLPINIGYAGRLVKRKKRIDLIIPLVEELVARKVNFRLFIAGQGNDSKMIEDYVKKNKLFDIVSLVGYVPRERIKDFWLDKDICINVSEYEGRCISKLEAMAMGCVPIVTDVAGTREDINNGVNGYYLSVGDYKGMADKIEYLSKNRGKLKDMGFLSYLTVKEKCDIRSHINMLNSVISENEKELSM